MAEKEAPKKATSVEEWIEQTNKACAVPSAVNMGRESMKDLRLARFSSGILDLDLALGGGWPFGRIVIVAGEYSTGKTLIATKACQQIEEYDHATKKHKEVFKDDLSKFTPGRALFMDFEHALDLEWASVNGFNQDYHVYSKPANGEQGIDIIASAIEHDMFDLIIVDSIAAITPSKEVEESADDWQMGLAARLVNKAMRRWNSGLSAVGQNKKIPPVMICLNQFRIDLGVKFGDPRTLPGGKGQRFASSIIIYTKSQDYADAKDADLSVVELRGLVEKNKTFTPRQNYSFKLGLKDNEKLKKGEVGNIADLLDLGKKCKLIAAAGGGKVSFNKEEYTNLTAFGDHLKVSALTRRLLWRSIIKVVTNQTV